MTAGLVASFGRQIGSSSEGLRLAWALGLVAALLFGCGPEDATPSVEAPPVVDETLLAGLDAEIPAAMARHGVPGLVAVVIANDRLVYVRPFGERQLAKSLPMTAHTLFRVDAGDAVISTLISTLVDDNRLEWSSPLPASLDAGPSATLLDLLSAEDATTGLARVHWMASVSQVAADAMGGPDRPRQTLHHLLQSKIFGPAGMTTTALGSDPAAISEDFASPYGPGQTLLVFPPDAENEGLALLSTAPDLARFLILHVNDGIAQSGKRVSSPRNLEETRRPRRPLAGDELLPWSVAKSAGRGMGWVSTELSGGQRYDGLSAGAAGFTVELGILPGANIGLVLLANLDPAAGGQNCTVEIRDTFLRRLLSS